MGSSRSSVQSRAASPRLYGSESPRIFTPPLRKLTPRTSRGFECIEFAEEVLEIELFPWQKWLLIHALETHADGTFRFRTVVLLVARQNGKSTLMQVLSLWRMYIDAAPLVIGTAQNLDLAEEVWQGAVDMAQDVPDLASEIDQVSKNTGRKFLKLMNGSRYKVQAASRRGGRGLSGDLVLLDELREHQNWDAWGAVTKTTRTRALAQIWAASNAGDITSVVLSHLRILAHVALGDPDGIAGDDAREVDPEFDDDSLGIFEWSAQPGIDVRDRSGWAQANPTMGHVPSMERSIASDAGTDPEPVFRTEVLCQWVDSLHEGAFPPGVWESAAIAKTPGLISSPPVVAVDVRTGMNQSASVVAAGRMTDGNDVVIVDHYEPGAGKKWSETQVVQYVAKALKDRGIEKVVLDDYGENGPLKPLFEAADIDVITLNTTDMKNACVGFRDAVINGRLKHLSEEPLNVAVLGAQQRKSGEAWLWSRNQSLTDIGPLMAAAAAWWVHFQEPDYDLMDSFY